MSRVTIAGVGVDHVSREEAAEHFLNLRNSQGCSMVTYANPHACVVASSTPDFAAALQASTVTFCDGTGVLLASRLLGNPLKGRFTFPQIADTFFAGCSRRGYRLFVVGERDPVLEAFIETVKQKEQEIRICGSHHGFFQEGTEEEAALLDELKAAAPDMILLGMGMPKQELWGARLQECLPQGVIVCVGALFLYYSGLAYRGPKWMTENGLEWLWRLLRHPIRFFRRYVVGGMLFISKVLHQLYREKKTDTRRS